MRRIILGSLLSFFATVAVAQSASVQVTAGYDDFGRLTWHVQTSGPELNVLFIANGRHIWIGANGAGPADTEIPATGSYRYYACPVAMHAALDNPNTCKPGEFGN